MGRRPVEVDSNDSLDVENEQWVRPEVACGRISRALDRIHDLSSPAGDPSVSPPRQLVTSRGDLLASE
jgi:hypothetical protein